MSNNVFGGNVFQRDIDNIMSSNAKKSELEYSHKKNNRWNMWMKDSGMTLSFVLNNGLFIPSISGTCKKTLEKFYSASPDIVNSWVKAHIRTYLEILKEYYKEIDQRKDYEAYEAYLLEYYNQQRMQEETPVQKYNRENDEFLTEEEYAQMYDADTILLANETKTLVKRCKPKKNIEGQLSLFDEGVE